MSEPKDPEAVKLIVSILFVQRNIFLEVAKALVREFGPLDFVSSASPFTFTDYYESEMGSPLWRRVVSFRNLISPDALPEIKLRTNMIEKTLSLENRRQANLDPGYIARGHLILATGKACAHRPYLRAGIYADLTLLYTKGDFQPLAWTYPDYGEERMRSICKKIRETYLFQLRERQKDNLGCEL